MNDLKINKEKNYKKNNSEFTLQLKNKSLIEVQKSMKIKRVRNRGKMII